MYSSILRRLLFLFPPELAHKVGTFFLRFLVLLPGVRRSATQATLEAQNLGQDLLGLHFANPVGLAAGFDKNGCYPRQMHALGFGFMEVGSVTALPWAGNAQPRLFRLPDDGALINRMGLNNEGAAAVAARLKAMGPIQMPLFVNVAKTPAPGLEGDKAVDDYVTAVELLYAYADVMVINVSCPNSGDGRTFEDPVVLGGLLDRIKAALEGTGVPFLVKVSPDLDDAALEAAVDISMKAGAAGIVACNTSLDRSTLTTSSGRLEEICRGGLSGRPVHSRAVDRVARIRDWAGPEAVVIGVGGICDAEDAQRMLDAGANLVEAYTGFVYGGPSFPQKLTRELASRATGSA